MKETKEMMKILSENKRKVQEKDKQLKLAKAKAKDILGVIYMFIALIVVVTLIAKIPDRHDVNRDGSVDAKDVLEIRQELEA